MKTPAPETAELPAVNEATFERACPTCGGSLQARFTSGATWAWCGACLRLSHPRLLQGPNGAFLVHPAAAA